MARNRLTLLQVVQRVLDTMGSHSVNSISDTIEATQIAEEARVTYYDLMDRDEWPHLVTQTNLESVSDVTRPNYLKIPQNIVKITDIRYETTASGDDNQSYTVMIYKPPEDFLTYVHGRNTSDDDVITVIDYNGAKLWIKNDEAPTYWTSFDDEYIVFDSYDVGIDTTLQGSKSIIRAKIIPDWTSSDEFIPDMPDQMFSTYLAEVTAAVFTYLKQAASPKDEQRARRGIAKLRREAEKEDERPKKAGYGRHRSSTTNTSRDGIRGSIEAARF